MYFKAFVSNSVVVYSLQIFFGCGNPRGNLFPLFSKAVFKDIKLADGGFKLQYLYYNISIESPSVNVDIPEYSRSVFKNSRYTLLVPCG